MYRDVSKMYQGSALATGIWRPIQLQANGMSPAYRQLEREFPTVPHTVTHSTGGVKGMVKNRQSHECSRACVGPDCWCCALSLVGLPPRMYNFKLLLDFVRSLCSRRLEASVGRRSCRAGAHVIREPVLQ